MEMHLASRFLTRNVCLNNIANDCLKYPFITFLQLAFSTGTQKIQLRKWWQSNTLVASHVKRISVKRLRILDLQNADEISKKKTTIDFGSFGILHITLC